jgi:arylsulfatase A-like enzyme
MNTNEFQSKSGKRPNVIIVLIDDQGYGDLECHGNPFTKTPSLNRLHDESVRFTDFHVCPMCTPTRGELMTGVHMLRNGATLVGGGRSYMRREFPTMPEIFRNAGYRTALFGKWHLGDSYPHRPQDRGFEEVLSFIGPGVGLSSDYWNNDYFDDRFLRNGEQVTSKGYCTDFWFDEAMDWMNDRNSSSEPFLLYLATNADHMPLFVPDEYRAPYRKLGHDIATYYAMTANVDYNMGRLDEFLSESGLKEDTILIYFSDNGGTVAAKLFNAGMKGEKRDIYDGGHRVPFFIRWPGGGFHTSRDDAVSAGSIDILPTVCDLCGIKTETQFDGISLTPLLRSGELNDERTLFIHRSDWKSGSFNKYDGAVVNGKWRLVNGTELYDIETDPGQENNLSEAFPQKLNELRSRYETWWKSVEPVLYDWEYIHVGNPAETETKLTTIDWCGPSMFYQQDVRLGQQINSPWNIFVEKAGKYRIELMRWPKEANAPIRGSLPAFTPKDHHWQTESMPMDLIYPKGYSLPLFSARLKIGEEIDMSRTISMNDHSVPFEAELSEGRTQLQSWFYDDQGVEVCGAYYVYIRKIG